MNKCIAILSIVALLSSFSCYQKVSGEIKSGEKFTEFYRGKIPKKSNWYYENGSITETLVITKIDTICTWIEIGEGLEELVSIVYSSRSIGYHPNGKIAHRGFYCKGEKCNKWVYFNEQGKQDSLVMY